MNAILIGKKDKNILQLLDGVQTVTDTEVNASNGTWRGIDTSAASVIVTDAYSLSYDVEGKPVLTHTISGNVLLIGDILPDGVVDKRGQLPKSEMNLLREQLAAQAEAINFLLGV